MWLTSESTHYSLLLIMTSGKRPDVEPALACVAGGIHGHKGGSLKYRLPKN